MEHGLDHLAQPDQVAIYVKVIDVAGSVPRDTDAGMLVFVDRCFDTIGGGHLEYKATRDAREFLRAEASAESDTYDRTFVLGASLGQCCGGRVTLRFARVRSRDVDLLRAKLTKRRPLLLIGAGHVGQTLASVLRDSPFALRWVDSRDIVYDDRLTVTSDPVDEIDDAAAGTVVIIMTHRHDLDYALAERALRRENLPYVGLIGSRTKRATFIARMTRVGHSRETLERLACPIGVPHIPGKTPYAIAISIVSQLLKLRLAEFDGADSIR